MSAAEILQIVTLGVAGWTLRKVIAQGEKLAALTEHIRQLPCERCETKP